MQLTEKIININSPALKTLVNELKEECQNVLSLINQLELSNLTDSQKGEILANLLVSSIHLHSHCDRDFQELISDELEKLKDET
jgi:hypothetical protein